MVSNQYEAILKDFGNYFKCNLAPDSNNSCMIKLNNLGISVQIEIDHLGRVIVASRLGVIQGRFRDNVLQQALKANDFYNPSTGIFGFSHKSSQLILFLLLDIDQLNPEKIDSFMPSFLNKAKIWAGSIKAGTLPALEEETTAPPVGHSSPFGLK